MIGLTIKIDADKAKDFFGRLPKEVARAIDIGLQKAAFIIEGKAKELSPVDTGRMRGSIVTSLVPLQATVAPFVNYAVFVHEGTRYMKGRPFMSDAAKQKENEVIGIINEEIAKTL